MENDERQKAHEGWDPELRSPEDVFHVTEEAFDYRGNVTVTTRDGERIEGYVFDRRQKERLEDSELRIIPDRNGEDNRTVSYADVKRIEFSGKDATEKNPWPPDDE